MIIAISYWQQKSSDNCYGKSFYNYVIAVEKRRGLERHYQLPKSKLKIDIEDWYTSYHGSIDIEYQYASIDTQSREAMQKLPELKIMFDFTQAITDLE